VPNEYGGGDAAGNYDEVDSLMDSVYNGIQQQHQQQFLPNNNNNNSLWPDLVYSSQPPPVRPHHPEATARHLTSATDVAAAAVPLLSTMMDDEASGLAASPSPAGLIVRDSYHVFDEEDLQIYPDLGDLAAAEDAEPLQEQQIQLLPRIQQLRSIFEDYPWYSGGWAANIMTDAVAVRGRRSEQQRLQQQQLRDIRAATVSWGATHAQHSVFGGGGGGLGRALAAYLLLPALAISWYMQTPEFPAHELVVSFIMQLVTLIGAGWAFRFICLQISANNVSTAAAGSRNDDEAVADRRRREEHQLSVIVWGVLAAAAVAFLAWRSGFDGKVVPPVSSLPPTDANGATSS
jgi:hypothetical protein